MAKLGIVIPCYNEENRFPKEEFLTFYDNSDVFFCLVNDGSEDGTLDLLKKVQKGREDRVIVHDLEHNLGKAEAVRQGIIRCVSENYDWLGMLDADFATHPSELLTMLNIASQNQDIKMVIGSRWRRLGANIERSFWRFFLGRIFATIVSNMLRIPVYDSQCGAKIFHKSTIQGIFGANEFISAWFFDIEILYRYISIYGKENAINNIFEYPVSKWTEVKGSKLKLWDFVTIPVKLYKLHTKYTK